MATKDQETTIYVPEISRQHISVNILGSTPVICNRMSEKARHELLLPAAKKNAAAKQASLKHNPVAEFQASPYTLTDDAAPTLLAMMSSAFKGAMCTAALDLPGTKKAQIGRLVHVEGDYTPIYGLPRLFMSVVRSADMNRTPDIRSRAIIPHWACKIEISFVSPILNAQGIINLLTAAGVTVGIGDWRPEKGKGNYGQFLVVNDDDPQFCEILTHDRASQVAAMEQPEPYDDESAEMLSWWTGEVKQRGFKKAAA